MPDYRKLIKGDVKNVLKQNRLDNMKVGDMVIVEHMGTRYKARIDGMPADWKYLDPAWISINFLGKPPRNISNTPQVEKAAIVEVL